MEWQERLTKAAQPVADATLNGVIPIVGDEFTVQGILSLARNPDRRWWQFWKPRMIMSGELQRFRVTDVR